MVIDLNKLKDIVNGVQFLSKADSGGNEEEISSKSIKNTKRKLMRVRKKDKMHFQLHSKVLIVIQMHYI